MPAKPKPSLRPRKTPRQERSVQMRHDLLEGATRVLDSSGAEAFTTNHVAEATGVSIGSLYQYYPNKAALLADLHNEDMSQLWDQLQEVLLDQSLPARQRFETVIMVAFEAQAAASEHHAALSAARVRIETGSRHQSTGILIAKGIEVFLRANIVRQEDEYRFLSEFCVQTVFSALGKLTEDPTAFDGGRIGQHTASMLASHLKL